MNDREKRVLVNTLLILVVIILFFEVTKNYTDIRIGNFDLAFLMRAVEFISIILTVLIALKQLKDSKEIARATFIKELNQSYVENSDYMQVYNMLQNCYDETCDHHPNNGVCDKCQINIEKGVISNYLTFFETIYILKERKVLDFKIIDDLFAYRFFLAVHSEYFQKSKLIPQPENFKNIFKLEREWLDYRVKVGKLNKDELKLALEKFRNNKDNRIEDWNNVYEARQLQGLVDEERYKELIK